MSRDDLARIALLEVARRCVEVETRPVPKAWEHVAKYYHAQDRAFGPRYSPTWFGALTETEAGRVRALRALRGLEKAGLVILVRSEWAGRLQRVRLTEEGARIAEELRNAETSTAVGT
ncbi:MAG: hypothetical protein WBX00_05255 [Isosphaeraceae bacterium]